MACQPEVLKNIPLFSLLDDEEAAVLASQVELKKFAARERIYKVGDPGRNAYVVISGSVRVSFTVDEDHQEVVVDELGSGEFFGFASTLEQTAHQTNAMKPSSIPHCIEVSRDDIETLLDAQADGRHGPAHHPRPLRPRRPGTGAGSRRAKS